MIDFSTILSQFWWAFPLFAIAALFKQFQPTTRHDSEASYSACFNPKKGLLSLDNTVCFDINAGESIC